MDCDEDACEATSECMKDTIIALATPPGRGGIGVLRLSGDQAFQIAQRICHFSNDQMPRVLHTKFYDIDNLVLDDGLVLFFKNPHSFTGEDVVELQAHGSHIVLDQLIVCALQ